MSEDPDDPQRRLTDLLDVEQVGRDSFRGSTGEGGWRLFGGQVASQALRAAAATVRADHHVNSLRAYYLRPGLYGPPVTFTVDRIRDGRSFTTRRVVADQGGEAILNLDASFHAQEPGPESHPPSPVPRVHPPERAAPQLRRPPWMRRRPVEMRHVDGPTPTARTVWVKAAHGLPDDPVLHACLVTYVTDMGPVGVVSASVGEAPGTLMMASLDHCLWFHRPVRADDWLLYVLDAVKAGQGRGLAWGSVWTRSGDLAATVAQEVLARPRDP
jgi:acyl-CoA thioesterase-2